MTRTATGHGPTTRPSTARKVTRKTEEKRDAANDAGLRITIAGESHTVRFGDVTPAIARQLRSEVGLGFMQLITEIAKAPEVDLLAAFVWTSKLVNGERVPLSSIDISYDDVFADDFDMGDANDDDEVTGPEA